MKKRPFCSKPHLAAVSLAGHGEDEVEPEVGVNVPEGGHDADEPGVHGTVEVVRLPLVPVRVAVEQL